MGTAGLDVNRLEGLLKRMKVDCILIDGDKSLDHCVLELSSVKRPGVVGFIEYENQGDEPRAVGLTIQPTGSSLDEDRGYSFDWEQTLYLKGSRKDDPEKISQWIERVFLHNPKAA